MKFTLFFAVAFSALVVAFSLQNSHAVQVQFLFWRFEGALVFVLLLTFAIGLLTMFLAALPSHFRSRALTRTLREELEKAQREAELPRKEEKESTPAE